MSDSHDELASAWLDGELSADERQRAAVDPAVVRARDELDAVRRQLATSVPVPADVRDRHLALALESLVVEGDDGHGGTRRVSDQADGGASVVPLRRRPAGVALLTRAAALLAVVGALGVGVATWSSGDGDGDDVALAPAAEAPTARSAGSDAAGSAESQMADAEAGGGEEADALELEGAQSGAADEQVQPGSADPVAVAAAADELLSAGDRPAAQLAEELAQRFGPAPGWGLLDGPTPACAGELDQRHPEAAPHVVLPLGPRGERLLVVDAGGHAAYLDAATCQPSP